MWPHLVGTMLGLWCMLAPWLLGFEGTPAEVSHRIAGPIIVTFSTAAWWQVLRGLRMVSAAAGAWLVVAPILVSHPPVALWNTLVVGVLVFAFALIRGKVDTPFAGGWRALWQDTRGP